MKCKKLLSALLACSMVASMSVAAFAADTSVTDSSAQDVNLGGDFIAVPIDITISDTTNNKVFLNPYGLALKLDTGAYAAADDGTVTTSVITAPIFVTNEGKTNINVNVSAAGTLGTNSKAKFATAPIATPTGKAKSVFMYVDAKKATDATTAVAANEYSKTSTNQIVIAAAASGKEPAAKTVYTLGKGDTTPTYAQILVTGSTDYLDTDPWTADDAISVAMKFSFIPTMTAATAA